MDNTGQPTPPSMLSLSRALLSDAKHKKAMYWRIEIAAALVSVSLSVVPWPKVSAGLAAVAVALKVAAKFRLSGSRRAFRLGERARRYDFYGRTLGWPLPPFERADLSLAQFSNAVQQKASELAASEVDYYAHSGPPSTTRLLCNLAESMFWTERLMGSMAKGRWGQFGLASVGVVVALVATVVVQPAGALDILRFLGSAVTLLVAIDIFGEAQSFNRGEREVRGLLSAVTAEMRQSTPSRDEAMRLLIEYNCLLADLPLLPDGIYVANRDKLNAAWTEFQNALPNGCGPSKA